MPRCLTLSRGYIYLSVTSHGISTMPVKSGAKILGAFHIWPHRQSRSPAHSWDIYHLVTLEWTKYNIASSSVLIAQQPAKANNTVTSFCLVGFSVWALWRNYTVTIYERRSSGKAAWLCFTQMYLFYLDQSSMENEGKKSISKYSLFSYWPFLSFPT